MIDDNSIIASLQALQGLYDAALARPRRTIRVQPLLMPAIDPTAAGTGTFGILVVVLAENGSETITELRSRARENISDVASFLSMSAAQLHEKRKPIGISEAIARAKALPSLVDIRHGGQALASNVPVLPGGDPTIYTFPYKGGELSSVGLVAIERYQTVPSVDVFAALFPPILSAERKLALEVLGDDERETLILPPSLCYAASAVGVAMVAEAVAFASYCLGYGTRRRRLN
jgi:hypothetical protein